MTVIPTLLVTYTMEQQRKIVFLIYSVSVPNLFLRCVYELLREKNK